MPEQENKQPAAALKPPGWLRLKNLFALRPALLALLAAAGVLILKAVNDWLDVLGIFIKTPAHEAAAAVLSVFLVTYAILIIIYRYQAGVAASERQFKDLNKRIEFILGATKTGLDIIDSDFNLRYVDAEWQKVYGDPAGRKCHEYFMGLGSRCPGCGIPKALETKKPFVSEEILPREGNRRVQVTTIPFQSENGEWLVAEVNVDITDRKKAEEAVGKFHFIIENAPQEVFLADADARLVYTNKAAAAGLGYTQAELARLAVKDVDEDGGMHYKERLEKLKEGGQPPPPFETLFRTKDGRLTPKELKTAYLKIGGQEYTCAFGWDITERKEREARIKKQEIQLREIAARLPGVVYQFYARENGKMGLHFVSAGAEKFFGLKADPVETFFERFTALLPQDDRERFINSIISVVKTQTEWRYEGRLVKPGGGTVWFSGHSAPVKYDDELIFHGILMDISERKKAELELAQEKERLLVTLRSIGDGVIVTDKTGRVAILNGTAEKFTGWTEAEARGAPLDEIFKIINSKTGEPCESPVKKVLRLGTVIALANHTMLISRDGQKYAIADSGAPIFSREGGEISGVVLVFRDVTQEYKNRDAMLLRDKAVESSFDAIAITDLNGIISYANPAFARIWQHPGLDSIVGKPVREFLIDTEIFKKAEKEPNSVWVGETAGVGKHGAVFYLHIAASLVKDEEGTPLCYVASIVDITKQKAAEKAILTHSRETMELSKASGSITGAFDRAALHLSVCKHAASITSVNYAWFGVVEPVGKNLRKVCSEGAACMFAPDDDMPLDPGQPESCPETAAYFEKRSIAVKISDGAQQPQWQKRLSVRGCGSALAIPVLNRGGAVAGVLSLASADPEHFTPEHIELYQVYCNQIAIALENLDLIESLEKRIAERTHELKLQTAEAERIRVLAEMASRAKSTFLANMSHELRTPLNVVISCSDVLLENMHGKLNEKQHEYLDYINSSAHHLLSLINDILDLTKVEAGRMELRVSRFKLRETLETALHMLNEASLQKKVRLELRVSPEADIEIEADQRKIRQIAFNLMSNAVKFSKEREEVVLSARKPDGAAGLPPEAAKIAAGGDEFVVISVKDSGIGIKREDMAKLFKPFSQLDDESARQYEGSGLGLALTKKLIQLHGGEIWAESEYGKGSLFSILLPVKCGKGADDGNKTQNTAG